MIFDAVKYGVNVLFYFEAVLGVGVECSVYITLQYVSNPTHSKFDLTKSTLVLSARRKYILCRIFVILLFYSRIRLLLHYFTV